jgi:hypothetical protein
VISNRSLTARDHIAVIDNLDDIVLTENLDSMVNSRRRVHNAIGSASIVSHDQDEPDVYFMNHKSTDQARNDTPMRNKSTPNYSLGGNSYYVEGEAGRIPVRSKPDTGAASSFVSTSLASRLQLSPRHGTQQKVVIGSGNKITSPGTVQITWRFEGEVTPYLVDCTVVPGLVHDLVLGRPFLQLTKTLTKFRHRSKTVASSVLQMARQKLSVNLPEPRVSFSGATSMAS